MTRALVLFAHPCEENALAGIVEAGERGLIRPILVGPVARIREIADRHGIDLGSAASEVLVFAAPGETVEALDRRLQVASR